MLNLQNRDCRDCIRRAVCHGTNPCENYEFATPAAAAVIDTLTSQIAEAEREIIMLQDEFERRC